MTTGEVVRHWVAELFDKNDKEKVFKILLIGDCVGKSSLLLRYCSDEFVEESDFQCMPMTLGLDVKSKVLEVTGADGKEEQVHLHIWDTAGQDRFRKMNEQYLPTADAVILLYDVRNLQTFKGCRAFVKDVQEFCDNGTTTKILVGNKDDFDPSRKVVPSEDGQNYASSIGYEFIETSAKDNRNVDQLFQMVAKLCLEKKRTKEKP